MSDAAGAAIKFKRLLFIHRQRVLDSTNIRNLVKSPNRNPHFIMAAGVRLPVGRFFAVRAKTARSAEPVRAIRLAGTFAGTHPAAHRGRRRRARFLPPAVRKPTTNSRKITNFIGQIRSLPCPAAIFVNVEP